MSRSDDLDSEDNFDFNSDLEYDDTIETREDPFADDFEFDPSWTSTSGNRFVNWWIIAGAGIVVLIIVAVISVITFLPRVTSSPEDVACAFYDKIADEEFAVAAEYVDPSSGVAYSILQGADDLSALFEEGLMSMALPNLLGGLVTELLPDLELDGDLSIPAVGWDVTEVECLLLEESGDASRVQVSANIFIYLEGTELGMPIDYQMVHDMVRTDGRWFVHFD